MKFSEVNFCAVCAHRATCPHHKEAPADKGTWCLAWAADPAANPIDTTAILPYNCGYHGGNAAASPHEEAFMRRKYKDCQRSDGNCALCPLVVDGLDCHGEHIGTVELQRLRLNLTQKELSERAGIDLRRVQRIEKGEISVENLTLGIAVKLADALEIGVLDLLHKAEEN